MKLIHITDTHLAKPGRRLYGIDPSERLAACIADIERHHGDADLCVITGDLTHWGELEAYRELKARLAALTIPLQLLVGNHDEREAFLSVFPEVPVDPDGFVQSARDCEAGRLLFLDTIQPGTHSGWYCEARQAWLAAQLEGSADKPVFLFQHHPPFNIGLPALDAIGIRQKEAFKAIVAPHAGRIRHLFYGHVHRPVAGSWLGIPTTTLRGTNHQCWLDFEEQDLIPGSHEPPAYAVVLIDDERVVVHSHDYLDASPKFSLADPDWRDEQGQESATAEA